MKGIIIVCVALGVTSCATQDYSALVAGKWGSPAMQIGFEPMNETTSPVVATPGVVAWQPQPWLGCDLGLSKGRVWYSHTGSVQAYHTPFTSHYWVDGNRVQVLIGNDAFLAFRINKKKLELIGSMWGEDAGAFWHHGPRRPPVIFIKIDEKASNNGIEHTR